MSRNGIVILLIVLGFIAISVLAFVIYKKASSSQTYTTSTTTQITQNQQGIAGILGSILPFLL